MKTTQQKGFTLIELLVVISIISFLSSIILSGFQSARMKARDSERIQEMRSLRTALGLYQSDQNQFPRVGGAVETVLVGLSPAYISSLPTDPNFIGFDGKRTRLRSKFLLYSKINYSSEISPSSIGCVC